MCISNKPAIFNNTKGYIGRTKNNTVVMAYQMEAQAIGEEGMRAIILQIPAKKIIKIHDTTPFNNFLNEMAEESKKWCFNKNGAFLMEVYGKSLNGLNKKLSLQTIGMYNVVVLDSYKELKNISKIFPKNLSPEITEDLIQFYSNFYSDWKFVVATFDNKIPMSSQPFMVEYESLIEIEDEGSEDFKEVFIFPALDNGDEKGFHQGIPKIDADIREDHFICFPHEKGMFVNFSQCVPENLISNRVGFYNKNSTSTNGDYIVFADGSQICKYTASVLGTIGLENILKCKHKAEKTNAYVNW